MRSVDDAIGFLAQDPMHATAQAKRHAGQLPAAAEEFVESTLFSKKDDSHPQSRIHLVFLLKTNLG